MKRLIEEYLNKTIIDYKLNNEEIDIKVTYIFENTTHETLISIFDLLEFIYNKFEECEN